VICSPRAQAVSDLSVEPPVEFKYVNPADDPRNKT